jgi:hypothetical protein
MNNSPGLSYAVHENPHVRRTNKTGEILNIQISTSYGCVCYDYLHWSACEQSRGSFKGPSE